MLFRSTKPQVAAVAAAPDTWAEHMIAARKQDLHKQTMQAYSEVNTVLDVISRLRYLIDEKTKAELDAMLEEAQIKVKNIKRLNEEFLNLHP